MIAVDSASFNLLRPTGTGGFLNPHKVVDKFSIEKGMSVADFGSGAGYFSVIIAEKVGSGGKVFAIDVLESALDSVMSKAKADGLGNIEVIRADLEVLGSSNLFDSSQDVVLIANVLFQSRNKVAIIQEAKRVLRPGGTLIVIDWEKGKSGLGPPDELRTNPSDIEVIILDLGFKPDREISAGEYHYGLIFRK